MKHRHGIRAALLLSCVGTGVLLLVLVSPLLAQDRRGAVQAGPDRPARQPLQAQRPGADGLSHRVQITGLELPGDTHITSPLTLGLNTATPGTSRRRVEIEYQRITLGGAISAQHDMVELFKRNYGRAVQLAVTLLSPTGQQIGRFEVHAHLVELSLDLEARSWTLDLQPFVERE